MKVTKKMLIVVLMVCVFCIFTQASWAVLVLYAPCDNFNEQSPTPTTIVKVGVSLQPLTCDFYNGQAPVTGPVGTAYQFSGNSYIKVFPKSSILNVGVHDFAITFWVKTEATKTYNTVIDKRANSNAIGYHVCLYKGHPLLRMHDSTNGYNYWGGNASPKVNDGNWHYVAIYVDRDNDSGGKIYIDGLNVHSFNPTGVSGNLSNNKPLFIGKHADWSHAYFEGCLDEVRIFRYVP